MKKRRMMAKCMLLALMLLVCGCGGAEQEVQAPEKSTTEDIFDPFGHIAMGYFDMTSQEIQQRHPEMSIALNDDLDPEKNNFNLALTRGWTTGSGGREFSELIYFEEQHVTKIMWGSNYYAGHEEEAKEFFYALCERMREITDEPMWCGDRDMGTAKDYSEVPIEDVEKSLSKNEDGYYSYRIDMENRYSEESPIIMEACGYKPFDPGTIKEDAKWIQGLEDAKVIWIEYRNFPTLIEHKEDNRVATIFVTIER